MIREPRTSAASRKPLPPSRNGPRNFQPPYAKPAVFGGNLTLSTLPKVLEADPLPPFLTPLCCSEGLYWFGPQI